MCLIICIVLSVHHAISISNHLMIPHATPTSNSLHHHHLLVLRVLLQLYHFPIQPTQSFTTPFNLTILGYLISLNLLHVTYHLNSIKLSIQL